MPSSLSAFIFLSVLGAIAAVWNMALISHGKCCEAEPAIIRQSRRAALAAIALSFLWGMRFGVEMGWQPWPPCLFAVAAIDALLGIAIVAAYIQSPNRQESRASRSAEKAASAPSAPPGTTRTAKWPSAYQRPAGRAYEHPFGGR